MRKRLLLVGLVFSLLTALAGPAKANILTGATVNATCTGYGITVSADDLSPNVAYTITYQFMVTCSGSTNTIPETSIMFTAALTTKGCAPSTVFGGAIACTLNASGGALVPSGSDCFVTGSATLTSSGSTVNFSVNGAEAGVPVEVDCKTITPPPCTIPPVDSAIAGAPVSWNKFNAPAGAVVWINAHIGVPSGNPSDGDTVSFTGVTFTLTGPSGTKTYGLPNGLLIFDKSHVGPPTTAFGSSGWTTTINPNTLSDEIFFDGDGIPVDSTITGGGKATLSFTTMSSDPNLDFSWQWSAAVYKFWPGDSGAEILAYHDSLHAGTPLNTEVQKSLIQGPRGGGGSNFTGSWSGTGHGTCPTN